jgi:hypothetical protein
MVDNDECEEVGGMKIGKENRSTRRKPVPVQICLPQIPYGLNRVSTKCSDMLKALIGD